MYEERMILMSRYNAVRDIKIEQHLEYLETKKWLIPEFQREFVWRVEDCESFAASALGGRPIGMVTVWRQLEDSPLPLTGLQVGTRTHQISFAPHDCPQPSERWAILDGRQRSQAAAMVFGGLRPNSGKFAGRFYFDATERSSTPRVRFIKQSEAKKLGFLNDEVAIESGMIPLDFLSSKRGAQAGTTALIMRCHSVIQLQGAPGARVPLDEVEIAARIRRVGEMVDGLNSAKLAVYEVGAGYTLGEICEIFERLNTTGTKVSTVDLIHSWLYGDTSKDPSPFKLRDWIEDTGAKFDVSDWFAVSERPELAVQMVAACYIALREDPDRPSPRKVGPGSFDESIKTSDLLAIPTAHWKSVADRSAEFAGYVVDFQHAVGNGFGRFGFRQCPYPSVVAIYVGLRWWLAGTGEGYCSRADLDQVFRAFFWRNALSQRYDQGMMARLSEDLKGLLRLLEQRRSVASDEEWRVLVEKRFDEMRDLELRQLNSLEDLVQTGAYGALGSAIILPQLVACTCDFVTGQPLARGGESIEIHHVFPRAWCEANNAGDLRVHLGEDDENERVDAVVNLMPLSRKSNNSWKAADPAKIIADESLTFANRRAACGAALIDEAGFRYLASRQPLEFWKHRARAIASDLHARMQL
jgi:hypothetical protein